MSLKYKPALGPLHIYVKKWDGYQAAVDEAPLVLRDCHLQRERESVCVCVCVFSVCVCVCVGCRV